MPNLHPAFIHFPIALVLVSFLCDFFAYVLRNSSLRSAAWWTLLAGGVFGIIAALTGLWDRSHVPMDDVASKFVDFHMWIGFAVLAAVATLMIWRGFIFSRRQTINFAYLTAALLATVLVLFQGWVGGEVVYSFGVGVAPAGQSRESPEMAQRRLKEVEAYLGPFEVSQEPAPQNAKPDVKDERGVR